jgi:hypothetical protein
VRARLAGHHWRVQKEKFPFYKKTEFGALKEVRRDWATFPHLHRDIRTAAGLDAESPCHICAWNGPPALSVCGSA